MVNIYDVPKDIKFDEFAKDSNNEGKVAIVGDNNASLFAEGDGDRDWVEIELLCEKMNADGNHYFVVIIPKKNRLIRNYDWSSAKWEN